MPPPATTAAVTAAASRFLVMNRTWVIPSVFRTSRRTFPGCPCVCRRGNSQLELPQGPFLSSLPVVDADIGQMADAVKTGCAPADVRHVLSVPAYYVEKVASDPVLEALDGLVRSLRQNQSRIEATIARA